MAAPADPWSAAFPHLGADRVTRIREVDEPADDWETDRRDDDYLDSLMGFREDPR